MSLKSNGQTTLVRLIFGREEEIGIKQADLKKKLLRDRIK